MSGPDQSKLGDAPVEPTISELMQHLAAKLDEIFNGRDRPGKVGFILIAFPFTETEAAKAGGIGRANYISNAKRDDVVVMLKEQIKRFEGQPEVEGHA